MNLLKLFHGFFKVILFLPTLCQTKRSWSLTKISNLVKLLLWIKGVEWVTVLNAFGPLYIWQWGFSPSVQVQCANVQGGRVCRRQEGPATLPRCLPHRQWATGGRRGCSMRSPVKKDSLSSSLDLFMISFILFITLWPLAVGHSCTIRSPVKKISK